MKAWRGCLSYSDRRLSVCKDGSPQDLCSREPVASYTKDRRETYWGVDLGVGRKLTPSHYTLRHGYFTNMNSLRNWRLEGSVNNDPNGWKVGVQ